MTARNAPTPGTTSPSASRMRPRSDGQPRIGSGRGERLDRGVHVARAVVEHRDERSAHRAPFVRGMPSTSGSSAFAWRNARANALYSASAMWCGSRPASTRDVHGERRVERDRLERVAHQRAGEVTADEVVLEAGRLAGVHEVGAAARCRRPPERAPRRAARARRRSARCRALSPSASRIAWPSTIATSSTVWCASMSVSPDARTVRSVSECFANAVSRWSKNGTVVSMWLRPVPSRSSSSSTVDSLVARRSDASAVRRGHAAESIEASASRNAVVSSSVPGGHAQVVRDADIADQHATVVAAPARSRRDRRRRRRARSSSTTRAGW